MKNLCFALLIPFFLITSCQKQPEACFATSGDLVAGQTVTFTNCSVDGDHFEWNLGDGTVLTGSEVTHQYTSAGTYSVQLIAYSKNEKKESKSVQSVVIEPVTGTATFWVGNGAFSGSVEIMLYNTPGQPTAYITQSYTGGVTACNTSGCATFQLAQGSYAYVANDTGIGQQTGGTVTVTESNCTLTEINF